MIRKTGAENDEFAASLAAIAAVDATESILSENCSAYHLANAIQSAEMGLYYPQGGAIALQNALCKTIRASGGCVLSNVDVRGLVFEEDDVSADKAAEDSLRALGVNIALREDNKQNITQVLGKQSVVSGLGAISTYIKLIPGENIAKNVKESLSSVIEARPIVKVLFWLDGTAEELGISSTDYVEIPENIIDILDGSIDQEVRRTVAQKSVRIWSPSVKDSKWNKRLQVVVVELEAVDPIVEQKQCKFEDGSIGPTIYCCNSSEGSITDPGNSGFISSLGHRLVFSKGRMEKFRLFALNKLIEVYPLTRNKEIFVHVEPPTLGGHNMSSTKAKFTAKLGAVTNVSVRLHRLFLVKSIITFPTPIESLSYWTGYFHNKRIIRRNTKWLDHR